MNEGGCDPDGRFYCGSMAYDQQPGAASLYRLDPDRSVSVVLDGRHRVQRARVEPGRHRAPTTTTRPPPEVAVFDYDREAGLTEPAHVRATPAAGTSRRPDRRRRGRGVGGAVQRRRRAPLQPGRRARRGGRGAGRGRSPPARSAAAAWTSCSSPPPARASSPARIRSPARCSASRPGVTGVPVREFAG